MTPTGPICQKGYVPVAAANGSVACNSGDVRVERPPYQLNLPRQERTAAVAVAVFFA